MTKLEEAAANIIDFAWAIDNGMSVVCIPWQLLWDLRDALEENDK